MAFRTVEIGMSAGIDGEVRMLEASLVPGRVGGLMA